MPGSGGPERFGLERPRVTAVICAHDERRWRAIGAAVDSLHRQTVPPDELILVVDYNTPLAERARAELEGVVVLENQHEKGLSGARNTGLEAAHEPLVAFLDDDAAASPAWLGRLTDACSAPQILGAGGRVVPRWLSKPPEWFPDEFLWIVGCTYRGMPARPSTIRNLYGGCFCIRRDVALDVGGFSADLGKIGFNHLGCEETELCIRASQSNPGLVFWYDPDAVIAHEVPPHRVQWPYFRARCYGEGVSKARLTSLVGANQGLASERVYVARALTVGFARETAAAVRLRRPARLVRSAAIVAGFAYTCAGYAVESARLLARRRSGA